MPRGAENFVKQQNSEKKICGGVKFLELRWGGGKAAAAPRFFYPYCGGIPPPRCTPSCPAPMSYKIVQKRPPPPTQSNGFINKTKTVHSLQIFSSSESYKSNYGSSSFDWR